MYLYQLCAPARECVLLVCWLVVSFSHRVDFPSSGDAPFYRFWCCRCVGDHLLSVMSDAPSFEYPFTIQNEEEHISHVVSNAKWYMGVISRQTQGKAVVAEGGSSAEVSRAKAEAQRMRTLLRVKEEEARARAADVARLKEQVEKLARAKENEKAAPASSWKGQLHERTVQALLQKHTGHMGWKVELTAAPHCMDIRVKEELTGHVVGIECKDKITVTRADVDKFKRDLASNSMCGGVFVATTPIPGLGAGGMALDTLQQLFVEEPHPHSFVRTAVPFIQTCFLRASAPAQDEQATRMLDTLTNQVHTLCRTFHDLKRTASRMDDCIHNMMELVSLEPPKGYLYLAPKSGLLKAARRTPRGASGGHSHRSDV